MSYTYVLTTPAGMIRLNTFQETDIEDPLFQDEEINALYIQERSSVKRASARLLEIVAAREVFIQKVIKLLALSTNGAAVAAELRAQAQQLREQADTEDAIGTGLFDTAEQVLNDFSLREYLEKAALRGSI